MQHFAQTAERIASTSATSGKIGLLAEYLRTLDDENLAAAAVFFSGSAFAPREQRTLSLGWSAIRGAAHDVWALTDDRLSMAYRRYGDLGSAVAEVVGPPRSTSLFDVPSAIPTPAQARAAFREIADVAGARAQRRRVALLAELLRRSSEPLVVKYVIKICMGELRIGLREGLIVDAIAAAFEREPMRVRRAAAATGDLGAVAVSARHDMLEEVAIAYFAPMQFMLATPLLYGSAYGELAGARWLIEEKYDGVRAQVHVDGGRVRIYSRRLNDVTETYPDIVESFAAFEGSAMLDGEIVAERSGRVLPFRALQARLQRKDVSSELLAEVPVTFVAFDALALDARFLIEEPLAERRRLLAERLIDNDHVRLAPSWLLEESNARTLHARFDAARERGNEGIVLKRLDSPYQPGKRGGFWYKLKRELSTLDCVVVAVEYGHGKRAGVISDYTFAVRGPGEALETIGKAYSGLTDAEIAELTPWFLAHRLDGPASTARHFPVEPLLVLEVAFDVIQRSDRHTSGFALRFPRIVRLRPDRGPADASTLEDVEAIYAAMLQREGLELG